MKAPDARQRRLHNEPMKITRSGRSPSLLISQKAESEFDVTMYLCRYLEFMAGTYRSVF